MPVTKYSISGIKNGNLLPFFFIYFFFYKKEEVNKKKRARVCVSGFEHSLNARVYSRLTAIYASGQTHLLS